MTKRFCLAVLLLIPTLANAGERPVRGPETLLGDAATAPLLATNAVSRPALATDGDELLFVWIDRNSLYAQPLTRDGKLATPLPVVLRSGGLVSWEREVRVVWVGGLYCVFYQSTGGLSALRLTRDLDVVDRRVVSEGEVFREAVLIDDELFVTTAEAVLRLRADLSPVSRIPIAPGPKVDVVPTPRGTLLVTAKAPAITVQTLDRSTGGVRLASVREPRSVRMIWTGTEFLVVWIEESGGCSMGRFDETLRPLAEPVFLGSGAGEDIGLTLLGDDTVFLLTGLRGTVGARYRKGVALDPTPTYFGTRATVLRTSQGQLFAAAADLNVYLVPPGGGWVPTRTAQPVGAAEEVILSVAASANGIAVARRYTARGVFRNLVSILDRDGNVLREVSLTATGFEVRLASDGIGYFALIGGGEVTWFQKVEPGAAAVKLPFVAAAPLAWTGGKFVTIENGWWEDKQYIQRARLRWLDRDGQQVFAFCSGWGAPRLIAGDIEVVTGGDRMFFMWYAGAVELRNGCPAGESTRNPEDSSKRFAWQDGVWAFLPSSGNLTFTFSEDPTSFAGSVYRLPEPRESHRAAIAPLDGRWLILSSVWTQPAQWSAAVVDQRGRFLGSSEFAGDLIIYSPPHLVPVARDRVLAVYTRRVYEPPYLGATRVMVAPVALETAVRRRGARS